MKLVLLRHATRALNGLGDQSLNAIGKRQADDLLLRVSPNGPLPTPTRLVVSPKKRTQESLLPLAEAFHLQLEIDVRLDERRQVEAFTEFEARVAAVISELSEGAPRGSLFANKEREPAVYLCSHFDWLEAAILSLPITGEAHVGSWATMEYRVFRFQNDGWVAKDSGFVPTTGASS